MPRSNHVSMLFAHTAGHCGAAIAAKDTLITTGSDTVVRLHDIRVPEGAAEPWWAKENAEEPESVELNISEYHEKPVNAVAVAPDESTMATACDDGFVRLFSVSVSVEDKEIKAEGNLLACTRFGGPVRALSFSPTGAFLAAAGDEPGLIKLIMTAQPTNVNILRASSSEGNEAVLAIEFDPLSDFVASIGEGGSACIWSVEKGAFVTSIELNNRKAKSIAFSHDGESLVVGTDKGAVIVSRNSWTVDRLLTDTSDGDDDEDEDDIGASGGNDVSSVAWSISNQYLLTGYADSRIYVWDLQKRAVLKTWKAEAAVQHVLWHPKHNSFVIVDELGQFGVVTDVVPSHLPKQSTGEKAVSLPVLQEDEAVMKPTKSSKSNGKSSKSRRKVTSGDVKSEDASAMKEDVSAGEGPDDDTGSGSSGDEEEPSRFQFAFDAEELDADDEEELERGRILSDTDNSDEEENGKPASEGRTNTKRVLKSRSRRRRGASGKTIILSPFVPTATPANEASAQKMRILHWNLVGVVLSFSESTHSIVEVEFADSARRSVRIKDHFGYSLGCLSEAGVLLSASKTKDHSSVVYFRPFSSWSSNSEWTQFLVDEENASVLALGSSFAAVGFEPSKTVRIFSLSGIQTDVFGLPGQLLTMVADDDQLAVVYCVPGSGLLRFDLYRISVEGEVCDVLCKGEIVVSDKAKIEWIGFARGAELAVYDSTGALFLLSGRQSSKRWVPMLKNTASTASCDWFWPIAVSTKAVIGVPCHSNERYPVAKPRPALRTVSLIAPVVKPKAKNRKTSIEERFFQCKLELNRMKNEKEEIADKYESDDEEVTKVDERVYRAEVELDKCTLALMQEACKNEQNLRAFDYATRLHTKVSFKYAVELAKFFKRTALAARVEQVATHKFSDGGEVEERAPNPRKRTRRREAALSVFDNPRSELDVAQSEGSGDPVSAGESTSGQIDIGKRRKVMETPKRVANGGTKPTVVNRFRK